MDLYKIVVGYTPAPCRDGRILKTDKTINSFGTPLASTTGSNGDNKGLRGRTGTLLAASPRYEVYFHSGHHGMDNRQKGDNITYSCFEPRSWLLALVASLPPRLFARFLNYAIFDNVLLFLHLPRHSRGLRRRFGVPRRRESNTEPSSIVGRGTSHSV